VRHLLVAYLPLQRRAQGIAGRLEQRGKTLGMVEVGPLETEPHGGNELQRARAVAQALPEPVVDRKITHRKAQAADMLGVGPKMANLVLGDLQ
jgi:hypothetical protein